MLKCLHIGLWKKITCIFVNRTEIQREVSGKKGDNGFYDVASFFSMEFISWLKGRQQMTSSVKILETHKCTVQNITNSFVFHNKIPYIFAPSFSKCFCINLSRLPGQRRAHRQSFLFLPLYEDAECWGEKGAKLTPVESYAGSGTRRNLPVGQWSQEKQRWTRKGQK